MRAALFLPGSIAGRTWHSPELHRAVRWVASRFPPSTGTAWHHSSPHFAHFHIPVVARKRCYSQSKDKLIPTLSHKDTVTSDRATVSLSFRRTLHFEAATGAQQLKASAQLLSLASTAVLVGQDRSTGVGRGGAAARLCIPKLSTIHIQMIFIRMQYQDTFKHHKSHQLYSYSPTVRHS